MTAPTSLYEIVLAPFGPARLIAPPEHRAGVGYSRTAIPPEAFKRVEAQMHVLRIDLAPWRRVCDQWLRWAVPVGQVDRDAVPRMPN
jgi:hypothetical protein